MENGSEEQVIYIRGDAHPVMGSQPERAPSQLFQGKLMNRCPRCGVYVQDDYLVCPYCALSLKKECPKCKRQIPLNWNACSYCSHVIVPIVPPDQDRLSYVIPDNPLPGPVTVEVKGKVVLRGKCPKCNRMIIDDARYCDSCGWKVEDRLLRTVK